MIKIFDYINNCEIETTIEQASCFKVGDKVKHKNGGTHSGGTAGMITDSIGEVKSITYMGQHSWGGHCFMADVNWADGTKYELATSLLNNLTRGK